MPSSIKFTPTALASALSLLLFSPQDVTASVVRGDIDYQYFRDFAENKGKFFVGASNVPIYNKQGRQIGTMLPNVAMPDLRVANKGTAVATLVAPQYISSVAHNSGYGRVSFGDEGNNPDAHEFSYFLVDRNKHPAGFDFHAPRLDKLVTEIAPVPMADVPSVRGNPKKGVYVDRNRFSAVLRVGSGIQGVRDHDNYQVLSSGYKYLTGGTSIDLQSSNHVQIHGNGRVFSNLYGPMATHGTPGDSGSPLFMFDKQQNRWVLVGVLSTSNAPNGNAINYAVIRPDFLRQLQQQDEVSLNNQGGFLSWQAKGNSSTISHSQNQQTVVPIADANLKFKDSGRERPSLQHGKGVHFRGKDGELQLQNNIDQGAGALYFHSNFTVSGSHDNIHWRGAGVEVDEGKTVVWKIKNPENDRLSKIGSGTLYVNGQGENRGDISVGDGTVILAQQPLDGKQAAFWRVGIVSGRPTVVLEDSHQVLPDNIYFGFRGGRLDVNGNNLAFRYIQNADEGARIINRHASHPADITINGDGRKVATFSGYFGGSRNGETNGRLNIAFRPDNSDEMLMLNGGSDLNGSLNVAKGKLFLSGRPVSYARNFAENQEIIKDDEWINRQFKATHFTASHGGVLISGRNVERLEGNFIATDTARLHLGFLQGRIMDCHRSDYSGETLCNDKASVSDHIFDRLPTTQVWGNIELKDHSSLTVGKSHLHSHIKGSPHSSINLAWNSQWTMASSSRIGSLNMETGSTLTLNPQFGQTDSTPSQFNHLIINGNLSGSGTFRYLTNAAAGIGDSIQVKGTASGNFILSLQNTGKEPTAVSPISLFKAARIHNFSLALENGYIDLGAYRYILAKRKNDYRLYNPLKEAQSHAGSIVDSEILRQQQAQFEAAKAEAERQQEEVNRLNQQLHNKQQNEQNARQQLNAANQSLKKAEQAAGKLPHGRRIPPYYRTALARLKAEREKVKKLKNNLNAQSSQTALALKALNQAKQQLTQAQHNQQQLAQQIGNPNSSQAVISHAQQLCQQQQLSETLCQKVVLNLDEEQLTPIEAAFAEKAQATDDAEATLERAKTATQHAKEQLRQAENRGDSEAVSAAKQAIKQAEQNEQQAVAELEQARQNEAQALLNIESEITGLERAARTADVADSASRTIRQADHISQYANTAVSELSASLNTALQQGYTLDHHLLSDHQSGVWLDQQWYKTQHSSDSYRAYRQEQQLTQLGVSHALNPQLHAGIVFSHSHSQNRYDQQINGKGNHTALSLYGKQQWDNGIFATLDLGIGRSRSQLGEEGQAVKFHRNSASLGINLGKQWQWNGWTVQPSVGYRHYHLSAADYIWQDAQIHSPTQNVGGYSASLKVSKVFKINGITITPSWSSYYHNTIHKHQRVFINQIGLDQTRGQAVQHQFDMSLAFKQWQLTTQLGYLSGKHAQSHKSAGLKLSFNW